MDESSPPFPLLPGDTNNPSEQSHIPDSDERALQRLVSRAIPEDELLSVIETVVSNVKAIDIVRHLRGSDAQAFIDVIDKARHRTIISLRISSLTPVSTFQFLLVRR